MGVKNYDDLESCSDCSAKGSGRKSFPGDPVVPGHDVVMALRLVRIAGVVGGETGSLGFLVFPPVIVG